MGIDWEWLLDCEDGDLARAYDDMIPEWDDYCDDEDYPEYFEETEEQDSDSSEE